MQPSGFPLKIRVDGSSVPSVVVVTATVTRFVSFVDVQMWIVFFPMTSIVRFEFIEKKTVDDETPVAISSADNDAHEFHEVKRLAFNFGRGSLRRVSAHSI